MVDNPDRQTIIRSIACGATAQLREIVKIADRYEARRLYTEMLRISAQLARKHEFDFNGDKKKQAYLGTAFIENDI